MSLARTCLGLNPLSHNWLQQYWITDIKDVSNFINVTSISETNEKNSARFCFDIDDFVTPCECDGIATCLANPCQTNSCPSYPEASCRIDFCGECKAIFHLNGVEVDCLEERDFCQPNPCENGGMCVPSIWPSEPQLTTCQCPPGFDGHYCQYKALDVCELPVSRGDCTKQESRWYFDPVTQTCKFFLYTGCAGNGNNFVSKDICEARCRVGACCYRFPKRKDATVGYNFQGFDRYGFNIAGQNRPGDIRTADNGIKTGKGRFSTSRYDEMGFDRNGYDSQGYDRFGLDKSGYDREGFNLLGYNRQGEYDGIIDYNEQGYDEEGYNRAGYSCQGTNREGLNIFEVYSEYVYRCRSATLLQCQRLEQEQGHQVIKFSPGKKCDEVNCTQECGCSYNGQIYAFGQTFKSGCQFCTCTYTGLVECVCPEIYRRKEIRDLKQDEMRKYQDAIKQLAKTTYPSRWFRIAETFAHHKPQAVGNSASLPWHRYFLTTIEKQLQEYDCSITIPYYDWTLHAGNQQKSTIWAANMFGGDGSGFTGCVDHHPFKDYYPPYWVPCLRRQFNTSLQLPDVVDIQYALNEETYERFRISMEVYFDIFKSWVGGTMASDYAPYDPLYLSVAAFIDRIWWDWQKKHENALLNYPQDKRYIPMMPFKATPDDVMDSKKQMCVTYFPLSEGAVCNITQTNLNYNSLGYDRHGFNREGYDIEGYNVFGLDKNGIMDTRGIYNELGFDREGFKRNGYDKSGFDRYGFYFDGYNVDSYDSTGYDRTGYDRYGFDRTGVTPFGFHRNGTLESGNIPTTFDPYGYNRYGLNRYGFDRQGYDIFGFDSFGYDKRRCNRYYLGQMLVLIKRWAELELDKVDKPTIRIITRICPPVSALPEWRYTRNWLKRDGQLPLIEGILGRAQQRVQGLLPNVRTTSVVEDNMWLPLGPDRNLCFVTYYYTECPFGEFPVTCVEDLCASRRCPGYPDAVCRVNRCGSCEHEWYNGVTGNIIECSGCVDRNGVDRAEGSSWSVSECETCTCQDGLVSCAETLCDPVTCTHPVKLRGQCCLSCDVGCDYEGQIYRDGQIFPSLTDLCQECSCEAGNLKCNKSPCPDLDLTCQSPTVMDGECCPVCLDCGIHGNGESWNETPCQECTCLDGRVDCERIRCIPPDCSNPWTPPGQCCPVCDGCSVDGQDLQSGETYQPEQCTECLCLEGNVRCDFLPCPIAPCINPITPAGECCPRCDNECEYNFRRYRHMESFVSSEDKCTNCTCNNGFVNCVPVTCPRMNLPCRRPVTLPGDCCPTTCPKCIVNGLEYDTGDTWKSASDPCETCRCNEGVVVCQRQERCPEECDHGVVRSGECCSECRDCVFDGQYVRTGQVFVRPGDNCKQCTCSRGQVTCESLGPCPRLPCRVTETPQGACCPQCKRCEYEGIMYTHGDTVYSDRCSVCMCLEGEVTCEREDCPEVTCRNPVSLPDQCCPVCLECQYKGVTYQEGQRFTPPREPCHECECRAGEVTCLSRETDCPISQCTHPIRSFRQCCPTCDGCSFMRRRFRNGQKFVPPGSDNCKVCRCTDGSVECSTMGCPSVNCDNAVLVKGQCCPVCPMGCNVMGIEYRDGQTFIDFMNRCQVCTCMMGQIRCMQMMTCPEVTCTHPANRPGNCCPSCSMCEQNSMQYTNGETFTSPADACQECVCRDGSITCRSKVTSCPRVQCEKPVLNPDTCCPVCESNGCVYAGRQFQDGQEVPASRDVCEMCECSGGLIDCRRKQCPAVNCRNPGRTDCCDTCEFCEFNGMNIELGKVFPSPDDSCEECVCMAGTVECQRIYCDIPNCSNPSLVPGSCCPQCTDCTYQGLLFNDGENFENPSNPCEVCHCMKGSVACDRTLCPKVNCQNPVQDGCCLRCTHCSYGNQQYKNGEEFRSPDGCMVCKCVDGQVKCDSPNCGDVSCQHPTKNQCCQECTDCLYPGITIQNGQSIQDPSDVCRRCICRHGTVTCDTTPCSPVTCLNPTVGECCPECRNCNYLGNIIKHGQTVASKFSLCEKCQCVLGNIQCFNKTCPPAPCMYPVLSDCCKSCTGCSFKGKDYSSGDEVLMSGGSCETCTCQQGNLKCTRSSCPSVNCERPAMGECCPECSNSTCVYNGRQYRDGETFQDLTEECSICQCLQGTVGCTKRSCPRVNCENPVIGECCPECRNNSCIYNNEQYRDGETFKYPSEECSVCQCFQGDVSCRPQQCQPVSCTNPVMDYCCPVCMDCQYGNEVIKHGEFVPERNGSCDRCRCESGNIKCYGIGCPMVSCTHPIKSGCCESCDSCLFNGLIVQNKERFINPTDPCDRCICTNGNVVCTREPCPPINCLNPVQGECCLTCQTVRSCFYKEKQYRDGESFTEDTDACIVCTCQEGVVKCTNRCPAQLCAHPYEGQCDNCYYSNNAYRNKQTFRDGCNTCQCTDGNVDCTPVDCLPVTCLNPSMIDCCPVCDDSCYHGDKLLRDGETLPDARDLCSTCTCREGRISCQRQQCPAINCKHPAMGQCCPECNNCQIGARKIPNGDVYPDPNNKCFLCMCKNGNINCEKRPCSYIKCTHPSEDECGCPMCGLGCEYEGLSIQNGQTFMDPIDKCAECICTGGYVQCKKKPCLQTCTHPADSDGCCAICRSCLYEGQIQIDGARFTSVTDPCMECVCMEGNVNCTRRVCPRLTCDNPLAEPGQCCAVCPGVTDCNYKGRTYRARDTFRSPDNKCMSCTCMNGGVRCERQQCLERCSHPRPGTCCPTCDLCFYDGTLYNNNTTFNLDTCRQCTCLNGSVICTEKTCPNLSCREQETRPNECCPVCKGCRFGDREYEDGESFSPSGDPCDICTCMERQLQCFHNSCPHLRDCPIDQQTEPVPGTCCPICNALSSCTRERFGEIRVQKDDPCQYCVCDNFQWECKEEICPDLSCPSNAWIYREGVCCPTCPACYDVSTGTYYRDGEEWDHRDNNCLSCVCKNGYIDCEPIYCSPPRCLDGERLVTSPAECCPRCEPIRRVGCQYQGSLKQDQEVWMPDECTSCQCMTGSVTCNSQACDIPVCRQEDSLTILPGNCCPVCMPKPGTCLVYGDPHYRTFDGSTLHFQGTCKYIMAMDCDNQKFRVEVHHDDRGVNGVSWAQNFTVLTSGMKIDVLQNNSILINSQQVSIPYYDGRNISIEKKDDNVLINTKYGMKLVWDGSSYAELTVPGNYKRKMCGLCGNFNGFPQDDMRTKNGQMTNSAAVFGNSWKVPDETTGLCSNATDIDPCNMVSYRQRKEATSMCEVLSSQQFFLCHRTVPVAPYYSSCVYDLCACTNRSACLCDILASYAKECAKAGVRLEWRSQTLCAIQCDRENGFIFDECGPVCQRTCDNWQTTVGDLTENCYKPCVASCQCTADKVVHNGRCILPRDCPP